MQFPAILQLPPVINKATGITDSQIAYRFSQTAWPPPESCCCLLTRWRHVNWLQTPPLRAARHSRQPSRSRWTWHWRGWRDLRAPRHRCAREWVGRRRPRAPRGTSRPALLCWCLLWYHPEKDKREKVKATILVKSHSTLGHFCVCICHNGVLQYYSDVYSCFNLKR